MILCSKTFKSIKQMGTFSSEIPANVRLLLHCTMASDCFSCILCFFSGEGTRTPTIYIYKKNNQETSISSFNSTSDLPYNDTKHCYFLRYASDCQKLCDPWFYLFVACNRNYTSPTPFFFNYCFLKVSYQPFYWKRKIDSRPPPSPDPPWLS